MIVSNDRWLHGFYNGLPLDRMWRCDPRLDLLTLVSYSQQGLTISIDFTYLISMNFTIVLWCSVSCFCVANWKVSPTAKMWLWETICFQNVFGMSCTFWTSRACSRHALIDDQREVATCKWQHVTAPLAWTTSLEVVLENGPYVAPSLDQEIYAPEEWNLGKQQKTAMASLVGLKVQPLGPSQRWFQGLIVCTLDWGWKRMVSRYWSLGVLLFQADLWDCAHFFFVLNYQSCQHWRFGTGWMCSKLNAAAMGALPFVSRDSRLCIADHQFAMIGNSSTSRWMLWN